MLAGPGLSVFAFQTQTSISPTRPSPGALESWRYGDHDLRGLAPGVGAGSARRQSRTLNVLQRLVVGIASWIFLELLWTDLVFRLRGG
jgi:hypothetical protein